MRPLPNNRILRHRALRLYGQSPIGWLGRAPARGIAYSELLPGVVRWLGSGQHHGRTFALDPSARRARKGQENTNFETRRTGAGGDFFSKARTQASHAGLQQERRQEPKVFARNQKTSPGTRGLQREPEGRSQETMTLAKSFRFLGSTSGLVRGARANSADIPRNR